jgi:hypothetical protein
MKTFMVLVAISSFSYTIAQQADNSDMKDHMKKVEKSKEKATVIWDMDTVFVSGVPYCIVKEKPNDPLEPSDYSVRSLEGKELIYVKYNSYNKPNSPNLSSQYGNSVKYYTYYFTDTQNEAEISFGSKVYKTVVKDDLVKGDHINSVEEEKFITLNGMKFSQNENNQALQAEKSTNSVHGSNIVERNRSPRISILNGQISQDNVTAGSVQMSQDAVDGIIVKTLTVFLPDGTKVAEAKCNGINSHDWNVITLKDNRSQKISSTFNNDAIDVVKYLVDENYL